jgi:hypothetical protein
MQARRIFMSRKYLPLSPLAILLVAPVASAQSSDPRETQARSECAAGREQSGLAILQQLHREIGANHYVYAQALCLEDSGRWPQAIEQLQAYLRIDRGLSPEEIAVIQEQIKLCERLANLQEADRLATQARTISLAPPAAPPDPRLAPASLPAVGPQPGAGAGGESQAHNECTKCYPGGLALVPSAEMPMAGLGAGIATNSQFTSSGGASLSVFSLSPYAELGVPGFRHLSLHYHATITGWVASGGGDSQHDMVVSEHTVGLKIVPLYDGRGDSLLITANAGFGNASDTQTTGLDYVVPGGYVLYSAFLDPFVWKVGVGGDANIAVSHGLKNSGAIQYFGQMGGVVYKREHVYSYLVAEFGGTVVLMVKETYTPTYGSGSSSGSSGGRTTRSLDATHLADLFFGLIIRNDVYQFKFGMDLPVTDRNSRPDYGTVMSLGFLF